MPKVTKRLVDASEIRDKDYIIWDDELSGFGLRVFASGRRSYLIQYRALGCSRRKVLKDIMAGKTRAEVKTKKLRGKTIVRGGSGMTTRTVGLLGGVLTYAVDAGIIEANPARGIKKPKDNVRKRRLTEAEYRVLGQMLCQAEANEKYAAAIGIIRQIALTGCRRSEMISLM